MMILLIMINDRPCCASDAMDKWTDYYKFSDAMGEKTWRVFKEDDVFDDIPGMLSQLYRLRQCSQWSCTDMLGGKCVHMVVLIEYRQCEWDLGTKHSLLQDTDIVWWTGFS